MHKIAIAGVKSKKVLIPLVLFVLVAISLGMLLILNNKSDDESSKIAKVGNEICRDDAIGQNIKTNYNKFGPEKVPEMDSVIAEIVQAPEYKTSINCLYIVGKYKTYKAEYDQSLEHFNLLLSLYESNNAEWIDAEITSDTLEIITGLRDHAKLTVETGQTKTHENATFPGMRYTE